MSDVLHFVRCICLFLSYTYISLVIFNFGMKAICFSRAAHANSDMAGMHTTSFFLDYIVLECTLSGTKTVSTLL